MSKGIKTSSLGYPRIGKNREWKKLLEAYWAGKLDEQSFRSQMEDIQLQHLQTQQQAGIDLIPVGDFTFYDHVLDTAAMFGIVPARYGYKGGEIPLDLYFAMARGNAEAPACEMTKWFNTNYHYIVPEIGSLSPVLTANKPLEAYRFAKERAGIEGKPVIVGLYTFLKLSKGFPAADIAAVAARFLPLYVQLLQELQAEGVAWVQIDEPAIVTGLTAEDTALLQNIYSEIAAAVPGLNLMLQTYFEAAEPLEALLALPVQGLGLDFVHDGGKNLESVARLGWPQDKVLGAGILDGRNIWRADTDAKLELVAKLLTYVPQEQLILQPASSLLHVPVTVEGEVKLKAAVKNALAFANEKLAELVLIAAAVNEGRGRYAAELERSREVLAVFRALPERGREDVAEQVRALAQLPDHRSLPFAERVKVQQEKWRLPLLPTTTIGSFPQTAEVRQARLKWRKGVWNQERYDLFIKRQIAEAITLQEELGLDVLVHGEFERTDMVEFFGEKLAGYLFTAGGWVQSYGSRCVKPPVIYADVAFIEPMTVKESVYAQSLTKLPVKGMLTGPVTILNWSFVRDDLSREAVAGQIALALRHEVSALEEAGIEMIQVDEPAIREGLPLKARDHEYYLNWAVKSFRTATNHVKATTQVHTHMCYSEFNDMIGSISAMDADVISIETSRSHGELIVSFEEQEYDKGIGLGVYDIHSPRVPVVEEMTSAIERALRVLDVQQFWINPDCGLKTRGWEETTGALRNMVKAAVLVREQHGAVTR
ncbi:MULTISPECIES: 5-methyltetrahydropteroyltriglutamate--homocysteine S-methyltransferase [unclassified Paenibacillus]|uniref:5-methyltetrahydropteroyltriglutamate-- homocysteine S-methyltransferase n=1 Tax=unclassified Paenibacillus TaxID=185978 RepID=UPI0003E2BA14|nr:MULTISPECIES: 5-methyltetrahydropteroyltriglutamate--homocysteine S-methyltransferase [unclassified Paenibacillus]ETT44324.1 5-methyltetrahydropteroyltriglutamate--homocysteine S-methyltransferase [Paenibacillus sp. FSL R7-269]OMF99857.1 5-methyltetrahydropteroyltriglutamate--homocysteine S-methyltransferase [Paenibacillus sp. FSL R7-0337]